MNVAQNEHTLTNGRDKIIVLLAIDSRAGNRCEPVQKSLLVLLGTELADEPGARV